MGKMSVKYFNGMLEFLSCREEKEAVLVIERRVK